MDLRRLRIGEWLTALAGVILLASLFLPWYANEPSFAREPTEEFTAWQSLAVLDVVLALIAAAAVALLIITATQSPPAVPLAFNVFLVFGGALATILVLFRAADLPDVAAGRQWALWLGLAGAVGILGGSLIALRDDRHSSPEHYTDVSGRPASPPAELEPISAPTGDLQSPR